MQPLATARAVPHALPSSYAPRPLVAFRVGAQLFAFDAACVRGALRHVEVTAVPLASNGLAGVTWHNGKVLPVLDLRQVLGMPPRHETTTPSVLLVVHHDETAALLVDKLEDVVNVAPDDFSPAPVTMDDAWRQVTGSVVQHPRGLIAVLEIASIFSAIVHA